MRTLLLLTIFAIHSFLIEASCKRCSQIEEERAKRDDENQTPIYYEEYAHPIKEEKSTQNPDDLPLK